MPELVFRQSRLVPEHNTADCSGHEVEVRHVFSLKNKQTTKQQLSL